jgi:hypothetical protein
MIDVEARFSPDVTSLEPVVAWITIAGRPTSAEKEANPTKPGSTAADNLVLAQEHLDADRGRGEHRMQVEAHQGPSVLRSGLPTPPTCLPMPLL